MTVTVFDDSADATAVRIVVVPVNASATVPARIVQGTAVAAVTARPLVAARTVAAGIHVADNTSCMIGTVIRGSAQQIAVRVVVKTQGALVAVVPREVRWTRAAVATRVRVH